MSKVVIVNDKNEVIGSEEFKTAIENCMIRRIVRVFVTNSEGQIFLQKRNDNKELAPGCWDVSAAGHVDEGESYYEAAKRELLEEVGIKDVELKKIAKFLTEEKFGALEARSFDELFEVNFDGNLKLDSNEIKGGDWFSLNKIREMIKENPDKFAPGLIISINNYKKSK